jgi:hypothetical protein
LNVQAWTFKKIGDPIFCTREERFNDCVNSALVCRLDNGLKGFRLSGYFDRMSGKFAMIA